MSHHTKFKMITMCTKLTHPAPKGSSSMVWSAKVSLKETWKFIAKLKSWGKQRNQSKVNCLFNNKQASPTGRVVCIGCCEFMLLFSSLPQNKLKASTCNSPPTTYFLSQIPGITDRGQFYICNFIDEWPSRRSVLTSILLDLCSKVVLMFTQFCYIILECKYDLIWWELSARIYLSDPMIEVKVECWELFAKHVLQPLSGEFIVLRRYLHLDSCLSIH